MNRLIAAKKDGLYRLCRQYCVAQLELFGSAARGASGPGRDLDFLVRFFPCTPEEHAERYLGLLAGLQEACCLIHSFTEGKQYDAYPGDAGRCAPSYLERSHDEQWRSTLV